MKFEDCKPEIKTLIEKSAEARKNAYAPYSQYLVGSAILTAQGEIFTGCNVENASYGATICAERTAVVKAISQGHQEIKALCVTTTNSPPAFPCGVCKQVLSEFSTPSTEFYLSNPQKEVVKFTYAEFFVNQFTKEDLKK